MNYQWKNYLKQNSNLNQLKLCAHELQEQYPFLVHGEKDGTTIEVSDLY